LRMTEERTAEPADATLADAAGASPKPRKGGWPKGKARKPEAADQAAAAEGEGAPGQTAEGDTEAPRKRKRKATRDEVTAAVRRCMGLPVVRSQLMQAPELMLSEAEAEALVTSSNDLADEFGIEIPGKLGAILAFGGTV